PLVLQHLGQSFGFPQVGKELLVFCQLRQWLEQVEPEIDSLLARVTALREVPKGHQRLLKGCRRLAEGGARKCPGPRLPAVGQGLVPHLAPQGVVRQAFDLLALALWGERLQGGNNAGVEGVAPLLQESPVGYLVRQGVFEGEGALWEEMRLVQEL